MKQRLGIFSGKLKIAGPTLTCLVRRFLGNNTDSVHVDDGNNQKRKPCQSHEICKKRHQFDVIPAIIFIAKNI